MSEDSTENAGFEAGVLDAVPNRIGIDEVRVVENGGQMQPSIGARGLHAGELLDVSLDSRRACRAMHPISSYVYRGRGDSSREFRSS